MSFELPLDSYLSQDQFDFLWLLYDIEAYESRPLYLNRRGHANILKRQAVKQLIKMKLVNHKAAYSLGCFWIAEAGIDELDEILT